MNKLIIVCIIVLCFSSIIFAINEKEYDEKKTIPEISLNLDINNNNGTYTLFLNSDECIKSQAIKLNTINYEISNITATEDIKDVDVFTFSLHNTSLKEYKDKTINLELTLYGTGYIINKR